MGKGGKSNGPSHHKGFHEHTPNHVKKSHYEEQIGHLQRKTRELTEPPEEGRGRSASRGRGRSASRGRGAPKQHDEKFEFPNYEKDIFSMIPLPSIFPDAMTEIAASYDEFYTMSDEMKTLTYHSYEPYCVDRNPHAFYTSSDQGPSKEGVNRVYAAYVPEKQHLTMDHLQLKSLYTVGGEKASVYYFRVVQYKKDGIQKEGFISFLFGSKIVDGDACSDPKFVCWILPGMHGTALQADQMPADAQSFYHFYQPNFLVTNIPFKDKEIVIEQAEIERTVKALRQICEKTRLMRSQGAFSVSNGIRANVYMRKLLTKTNEENPEKGHRFQMIVPYTSNKAKAAQKIIKVVMLKCLRKVTEERYLKGMNFEEPGTDHTSENMIAKLWLASVWVISTEMCRELMTPERIKSLTDNIFHDFSEVYVGLGAWPGVKAWEQAKKGGGITLKTKAIYMHMTGSRASAYTSVMKGNTGSVVQAPVAIPGADDTAMGVKKSRIWDDVSSTTRTPIDTW
jgi:hypothetical protein